MLWGFPVRGSKLTESELSLRFEVMVSESLGYRISFSCSGFSASSGFSCVEFYQQNPKP